MYIRLFEKNCLRKRWAYTSVEKLSGSAYETVICRLSRGRPAAAFETFYSRTRAQGEV